jgi:aerobic-type carbon monoxide dehydrogenase small subunit (CoxS/CutS family)
MAAKDVLSRHSTPDEAAIAAGLGGNLCRCGAYIPMRKAILEASRQRKGTRNA